MKNIYDYLHAPSSFFKSVTKGEVILTHIICILLCLVVAVAETYPLAAIFITALIGAIIFRTKARTNESDQ